MKLLLDEMYAPRIAEQLRARGHDVALVHDPADRRLEGVPDDEAWASAVADGRALVSENVQDFRRIEAGALGRGDPARSSEHAVSQAFRQLIETASWPGRGRSSSQLRAVPADASPPRHTARTEPRRSCK